MFYPQCISRKCKLIQPLWKALAQYLVKLNTLTSCNTAAVASPPVDTHTRETAAHAYLIAVLVTEAKTGNTLNAHKS